MSAMGRKQTSPSVLVVDLNLRGDAVLWLRFESDQHVGHDKQCKDGRDYQTTRTVASVAG